MGKQWGEGSKGGMEEAGAGLRCGELGEVGNEGRKYGSGGVGKVQEGRELEGKGRQIRRGLELVGVEQAGEEKKQG